MLRLILKGIVVLLVIILVAFMVAAIVIPNKKSFTQETEIGASRETIWIVLNDKEKYTEWQDQLAKIEVKDDKHWTEFTKNTDPIEFTLVSSEEPVSMRLEYKMGESYVGTWSGELRRISPEKTIIRTTDTTEVKSVVMKVMMAMFFDIEDFAKDWNQKLKRRAEGQRAGSSMDN